MADRLRAGRLLLLTTADTEILAAARAAERLPDGFPEVRCANPATLEDPASFFEDELPGVARRDGASPRRAAGVARGPGGTAPALRAVAGTSARLRRGGGAGRGAGRPLDRPFWDRAGSVRVPAPRRRAKHGEPLPLRRRHRPHGGLRLRASLAPARDGRLPPRPRGGLDFRRPSLSARPGPAHRRRRVLQGALDGREHRVRGLARGGARGGRGERPAGLLLLAAGRYATGPCRHWRS